MSWIPRKLQLGERAEEMHETPDPTPLEVPSDLLVPPTLEERMKAMIRQELSAIAVKSDMGSFEEENDFEEDDEEADLLSDYQIRLMLDEVEDSNTLLDVEPQAPAEPPAESPESASNEAAETVPNLIGTVVSDTTPP